MITYYWLKLPYNEQCDPLIPSGYLNTKNKKWECICVYKRQRERIKENERVQESVEESEKGKERRKERKGKKQRLKKRK